MTNSGILDTHPSKPGFGALIRRNVVRPWFVIVFNMLLVSMGLFTDQQAYLLIALVVLFLSIILLGNAYIYGILWILGLSTVTGFYQRLVLYGSGQMPSADYVRLALEVSVLLYFVVIVSSRLKKQNWKIPKSSVKWLDIAVLFYLLISTVHALNLFYVEPLVTIYGWRWVVIPILMYYTGRIIGGKSDVMDVVNKYVVILLLLQAGYGAYQSLIGFPGFEQPWINYLASTQRYASVEDSMFIAGKARIFALTEGHTSAGFLVPVLFLWSLFIPSNSLSKRWRNLRYLALISGLIFLIFSNERSAVGMVGVGIAVVIFLRARKKLGTAIFFVAIPVLLLIVFAMSQVDPTAIPWTEETIVLRRLLELFNPLKSGTFSGRMTVYWPLFYETFLSNPLGYGLGSFHVTRIIRLSIGAAQTGKIGSSPHNMYFQILLETGIMGLASFLAVLMIYFKNIYDFYKLPIPAIQKGVAMSAASSLAAFLAIGMANQPIETFPLALHFWFLMGVASSYMVGKIKEYRYKRLDLLSAGDFVAVQPQLKGTV